MATKRDLVEAYSFSRRRLVTAFVSGAPGGREVEPARPGRTIVGGLALAVLLVAGAAIAGVFSPRDPEDWNKPGLVVSKETGASYVILAESSHPVLRPVINITSARLMLPDGATPTLVSQDTIDAQTIGDDIGILGAPASLPTASLLIDSGWTACTADGHGIRLDVSERPQVDAVPGSGFLVESGGDFWVIAQARGTGGQAPAAYRYEVPTAGDDQDNMLRDLQLPIRGAATRVPAGWLDLFPAGGALDWRSFGLRGLGDPLPYAGSRGVPADARVGDVVTAGGDALLLTAQGPTELDPFAAAVYRHTRTPAGRPSLGRRVGGAPRISEAAELPAGDQVLPPFDTARWPDRVLATEPGEPCAELTARPGRPPAVQVATDPRGDAVAAAVPADRVVPTVDAGRGAYVLSGDWGEGHQGSPFVVDAKGLSYPLVGPEAADRLGYGDHPVVVVPDTWIELFGTGVNLSVKDALCPPASPDGRPCA